MSAPRSADAVGFQLAAAQAVGYDLQADCAAMAVSPFAVVPHGTATDRSLLSAAHEQREFSPSPASLPDRPEADVQISLRHCVLHN